MVDPVRIGTGANAFCCAALRVDELVWPLTARSRSAPSLVNKELGDESCTTVAQNPEEVRAQKAWAAFQDFQAAPKHKCANCWLMARHCCCAGVPRLVIRPRVVVVMHYAEFGRHLGSNTAKLLTLFGGELRCWGLAAEDGALQRLFAEDPEGSVVLFPGPSAMPAAELAETGRRPRRIFVLDGGWKECKRINQWIPAAISRCVVTSASREEYGGTRKYGGSSHDADGRVQTAAAFIALMQELDEEPTHISAMKAGLAHFMECWESQIRRSKTWVG